MKIATYLLVGCWSLGLVCPRPAPAQLSVDWSTVDAGGGTSTGGVFSVTATIGQPDAGVSTCAGKYSVAGGFWGLLPVAEMPCAPLLAIFRTTTNTVVISWPSPSTGFVLQQNTDDIRSGHWSSVGATPTDDGSTRTVTISPPTGIRFYRLAKP